MQDRATSRLSATTRSPFTDSEAPNYDNILKFPDRHPGARLFRLETNYRSTPEIVAFTNASIVRES